MYNLYEKISCLCAERHITPGGLCGELGFRRSILSDLKNGRKKTLDTSTIIKIADYFGVTVDYLLGNTDIPSPAAQKENPQPEAEGIDPVTQELYDIIGKLSRGKLMMLLEKAQEIEKF